MGKSITQTSEQKKSNSKMFGKFDNDSPDSEVENRNPAFRFGSSSHGSVTKAGGGKAARNKVYRHSSSSSEDEFDAMSKSQSSLSAKWSVTSLEETFKGAEDPREKILDDLDDDEEFNAMTREEKMEAMKPTAFLDGTFDNSELSDSAHEEFNPVMNLDGGMSLGSENEEELSQEKKVKKRTRLVDSSSEEEKNKDKIGRKSVKRKKGNSSRDFEVEGGDSDTSLPEIRTETPEDEYSLDGNESEYFPEGDESR